MYEYLENKYDDLKKAVVMTDDGFIPHSYPLTQQIINELREYPEFTKLADEYEAILKSGNE